ncbi:hypothetical protein Z945_368 [Sulfitobacter noctilucae]|nr:hypothetical protein Z945_368 [Sulfitobacter noctilucae]
MICHASLHMQTLGDLNVTFWLQPAQTAPGCAPETWITK